MAWQDRVRQGKYRAPSGEEIAFDFEDVRLETVKKTSTFTFANVSGAYVQDNGAGSTTFPMRVYITGSDYDQTADDFERLLSEEGAGTLTHPKYGDRTVVPTQIRRRDDLVTAAGQAVFDVPFVETITQLFPRGVRDEKSQSLTYVDNFDEALPPDFDNNITTNTSNETQNLKTSTNQTVLNITSRLGPLATKDQFVLNEFDAAAIGIFDGIDDLVNNPRDLASQINNLIRIVTGEDLGLLDVFDAFSSLISDLTTDESKTVDNTASNSFAVKKLSAYSSVVALGNFTSGSASYRSRQDAIFAANNLQDQFDAVESWDSDQRKILGIIDTGVTYQPSQELVANERGRLTTETFGLPLERRFFTDRTRNIVELATRLYGNADDDTLNLIIDTNEFVGPDLLQIPAGREVVYFK